MRSPSRRSLLVAGAFAVATGGTYGLVEAGILPGKGRLDGALGRCGVLPVPPDARPGPVTEHAVPVPGGGTVRALVGRPPGSATGTGLPVVVMLHGANGDARTPFDQYAIHRYLADAVRRRVRPFAVASVDNWVNPGVTDALLPFLATLGMRSRRVGLLGWSMGGDGVLALAARLGPGPVAAVAATSPAITTSTARSYARRLTAVPTWAACGSSDAFAGPTQDLLSALRAGGGRHEGGIYPGCHDAVFRRRMLPRQLAFLGAHLA